MTGIWSQCIIHGSLVEICHSYTFQDIVLFLDARKEARRGGQQTGQKVISRYNVK